MSEPIPKVPNLFDVVCQLDDLADDLDTLAEPDEATLLRDITERLKGDIVLRITAADAQQ